MDMEVPVIEKSQELETQQIVESSINTSQEVKPATTLAHSVEIKDTSSSSNDEQVVVPTNSAASTTVSVVSSSSSDDEGEEDDWGRFGWYRRRQEPEPDPKKLWEDEDKLSLEERRARYHCGKRFTKVEDILNLNEYYAKRKKEDDDDEDIAPKYDANEELNAKIALWHGDITRVEVDAIVNAANESCLGGGGVDGAIHNAAGNMLYQECRTLHGCPTGQTKITRGYKLPAKYVLHTVGPIGEDPELLESCYKTCLELVEKHTIKTVVFCGISTGIFGYPLTRAAHVALKTVREWIQTGDNKTKVDKIILCTFLDKEKFCYDRLTPLYFPPVKKNDTNSNSNSNSSEKKEDVSIPENKE